jgi:aquaporin Z
MAKYTTEFIGTSFLGVFIGLAIESAGALAPLAIGCGLTALVYMGGPISYAHYNPAVTLAFLMKGEMPTADVAPYVVAQLSGAALGAFAVAHVTGATFALTPSPDATLGAVMLAEILFTYALVLVILNVAIAPAAKGNQYYGIAIGFVVAGGAFAVGGISGGAFNPAVGTGPIVVHALLGGGTTPSTRPGLRSDRATPRPRHEGDTTMEFKPPAWMDLTVPDADTLKDFYASALGWKADPVDMGEYSDYNMVRDDGSIAGGVCHRRGPNVDIPPVWIAYAPVEDLEACVARVLEHGGEVITGPKGTDEYRYAIIRDPAGAALGLIQSG